MLCLYAHGRYQDFNKRVSDNLEQDKDNRWVAAICSFVADQVDQENLHPFCKNPLDFLSIGNIKNYIEKPAEFIQNLADELRREPSAWEPAMHTTNQGFHTSGNLFEGKTGYIAELEAILKKEITAYHHKFKAEDCTFMSNWPKALHLTGWSVRLKKDGYQSTHIHPSGWLSGVIYLNLVESDNKDEGSIIFELHGYDYPILNEDYPKKRHVPEKGDIVLFPSSLFHYTVPIRNDGERLIVAYDVLPD